MLALHDNCGCMYLSFIRLAALPALEPISQQELMPAAAPAWHWCTAACSFGAAVRAAANALVHTLFAVRAACCAGVQKQRNYTALMAGNTSTLLADT